MDKKLVVVGVGSFVGGVLTGFFGPKAVKKVKDLVSKKGKTEEKAAEDTKKADEEDHIVAKESI